MFKCEICEREFESVRGICCHLRQFHKIKNEDYYLKYINPEKGICQTCGKNTNFINILIGYQKYCSYKCANNNLNKKEKYKQTCLERYGVDNPSKCDDFNDKYIKTCLERYGVDNPSKCDDFNDKYIKTSMKNHGVERPFLCEEISKKNKLNFEKVQERYPDLVKYEELISGSNGEILGHCKNSKCKNSKENGGYFEVTSLQIYYRNIGIKLSDLNYFYCCEECKQECPLYHRTAVNLNNLISEDPETPYTSEEYSTFRNEVLLRQLQENLKSENFCEICHSTENLHVHHIQPQKLEPGYALDPPNGIILCQKCHFEKGHEKGSECSTGNLASRFCNKGGFK